VDIRPPAKTDVLVRIFMYNGVVLGTFLQFMGKLRKRADAFLLSLVVRPQYDSTSRKSQS